VQWLQDLNEAQKRAVTYGDGPLLVIAGAGTGKTRVLTYRIAYLLREKGVAPSHILAVTFTNKAAAEMKERLLQLVGPVAHQVWAGTFHSACVQILRRHAEMIGYSNRFSISDTSDQIAAVRQTLRELDMDAKKFDPRAVLSAISAAKNELLDAEDYADRAHDFWEQNVARVYPVYQQKLESSDSMDFDDLIMHTVSLFECHPDILELYRERLHYILVDEYQDTNHAQYRLVRLLAGENGNLCVVGDADQSIYRFRGADIRNILSFSTDYPTAKMVKLEKNYRSTRNILDAANHLISNNLDRPEKNLYTDNPEGDPVFVHQVGDGRDEAAFVADEIARWQRSGRSLNTVAILYRTHAQSRGFEEEFVKRNMPTIKTTGNSRPFAACNVIMVTASLAAS
jgi:DNA helicase-2/ATP-dependent DNA helicase PcrA